MKAEMGAEYDLAILNIRISGVEAGRPTEEKRQYSVNVQNGIVVGARHTGFQHGQIVTPTEISDETLTTFAWYLG